MEEQPPPIPNAYPPIHWLVLEDIARRAEEGRRKYGTYLQPWNGRDALVDAYEECLDMASYLKQAIQERDAS